MKLQEIEWAKLCVNLSNFAPWSEDYKVIYDIIVKFEKKRLLQLLNIKNQNQQENLRIFPFYKNNGEDNPAGYVVVDSEDNITIAYHGTLCKWEIINDTKVTKSPIKFGSIELYMHTGFKYEYEYSRDSRDEALREALTTIKNKSTVKYKFAGHSMGGVLCSLTALEFYLHKKYIDWVITFGSPRFFCKESVNIYNRYLKNKTHQIKIQKDPALYFPPKFLNYGNVGNHYIISLSDMNKHSMSKYSKATYKFFENEIDNFKKDLDYDLNYNLVEYLDAVSYLPKILKEVKSKFFTRFQDLKSKYLKKPNNDNNNFLE